MPLWEVEEQQEGFPQDAGPAVHTGVWRGKLPLFPGMLYEEVEFRHSLPAGFCY